MRRPRLRFTVRGLMAVALAAGGFALAHQSRRDLLSCHVCHNRRVVQSHILFGVPTGPIHQRQETAFPEGPAHRHQWTRYSRRTSGLLLGVEFGCRAEIYADGSTAPDGRG